MDINVLNDPVFYGKAIGLFLIFCLVEIGAHSIIKKWKQSQANFPQRSLYFSILLLFLSLLLWLGLKQFPGLLLHNEASKWILLGNLLLITASSVYVAARIHKALQVQPVKPDRQIQHGIIRALFSGPVRLLILAVSLYASGKIFSENTTAQKTMQIIFRSLFTLSFIVFFYQLLESLGDKLSRYAEEENNSFDKTQVETLRFILKIALFIIGGVVLIQQITGTQINTLLAGLGIGGVALALGVQDVLKNFFGSMMILSDRPFKLGERILIDSYDGIIEGIGFRSTRLRTLTGNLVVLPNETVAKASIENVGKRQSIRKILNIKVTYDTPPDKMETVVERLKEIMANHEGKVEDFPPRVYFDDLDKDALNIKIIFWYSPPHYWDYLAYCEKLNLQIMRLFEELEVDFAFPTITVDTRLKGSS